MAGDLERERVPHLHIMKVGRWNSDRAMRQYARDGLAQRLQRLTFRDVSDCQEEIQAEVNAVQAQVAADTSEEEYGSSSEDSGET